VSALEAKYDEPLSNFAYKFNFRHYALLSKMISPYDVTKVAVAQTQKILNGREHSHLLSHFQTKHSAVGSWDHHRRRHRHHHHHHRHHHHH